MVIYSNTPEDDLISKMEDIFNDEEKYEDPDPEKGIVTGKSVYRFPRPLYTFKGQKSIIAL